MLKIGSNKRCEQPDGKRSKGASAWKSALKNDIVRNALNSDWLETRQAWNLPPQTANHYQMPFHKIPLGCRHNGVYFQCYVYRVALADKSVKLRILIIDMFRFKLQSQMCKVPPEFLFQNGICLRGITWVSKFFVTQSPRFAKGSGPLSKNVKQVKMVSFHSYNELFHEK